MPANTTPDNIPYPVAGDVIVPLRTWFANLASGTQTAISNLRTELAVPALPAPISGQGNDQQAVTASSWADLPGFTAITLTTSRPVWVTINIGAWLVSLGGSVRVSARVTGATTLGETQLEVGGPTTAWGQVLYLAANAMAGSTTATRTVRLNAGTNTIQMRAYRETTAENRCNYSTLQVSPIRWG